MKIVNFAAALVISTIGAQAHALGDSNGTGLFLEPGLSYQLTESNVDYPGGTSNSSATSRGYGVVLRGGVHAMERFFVAADARYAMLKFNDNANNYSTNATSWDIAPVVGVQMADYGVRLYGGYILAGNLDPKGANGADLKFEDGTGWRVGAGLKLQAISVNIEWQRIHYGDSTLDNASVTSKDIEYNADGLVASVTFPLEFD